MRQSPPFTHVQRRRYFIFKRNVVHFVPLTRLGILLPTKKAAYTWEHYVRLEITNHGGILYRSTGESGLGTRRQGAAVPMARSTMFFFRPRILTVTAHSTRFITVTLLHAFRHAEKHRSCHCRPSLYTCKIYTDTHKCNGKCYIYEELPFTMS